MTWRVWLAMIAGALAVAAGWWAAGEMFTETAPTLGSVVVIGSVPSASPTPPHAPDNGEGAAEVPPVVPPSAGDDDDGDDVGDVDDDGDHEDVDAP